MRFTFQVLCSLILIVNIISAQNEYPVEYYKMQGVLTEKDLFKNEFGRYDGFELPLNKNENAYFFVYSEEFSPSLILVSPEGTIYEQSDAQGAEYSTIRTTIPQQGNWYIYVVGNNEARGEYHFHYGFAGENSLELAPESEFCSKLNYLISHSKAHYVFLENPKKKIELPVLESSAINTYINSEDASYNSVLFDGTSFNRAIKIFTDINKKIKECLGGNWKTTFNDFEIVADHREQSVEYKFESENETRIIQLILADFRKTKERFFNDYAVVLVVNSL